MHARSNDSTKKTDMKGKKEYCVILLDFGLSNADQNFKAIFLKTRFLMTSFARTRILKAVVALGRQNFNHRQVGDLCLVRRKF